MVGFTFPSIANVRFERITVADTRCQVECEDWIRREWMPTVFGQPFYRERVQLTSGGVFDFDAVSADRTIIASISTSGSRTAPGKHATGKMMKLRSDILYLLMTNAARRLVILCEKDMYERCKREVGAGRLPKEIECGFIQNCFSLRSSASLCTR